MHHSIRLIRREPSIIRPDSLSLIADRFFPSMKVLTPSSWHHWWTRNAVTISFYSFLFLSSSNGAGITPEIFTATACPASAHHEEVMKTGHLSKRADDGLLCHGQLKILVDLRDSHIRLTFAYKTGAQTASFLFRGSLLAVLMVSFSRDRGTGERNGKRERGSNRGRAKAKEKHERKTWQERG